MENGNRDEITLNKDIDEIVYIIWIDDDLNKQEIIKNITFYNENLKITLVHPLKFKAKEYRNRADLFLVDFFLNRVKYPNEEKFDDLGYTIAGKIRENIPDYPIYGTSEDTKTDYGLFNKNIYISETIFDKILDFELIRKSGEKILYNDAISFKKIRESELEKTDIILDLLKAPKKVKGYFQLVFPSEIRKEIYDSKTKTIFLKKIFDRILPDVLHKKNTSKTILFARWVINTLLKVPGFLYDELHAATHLGMKVKCFKEIKNDVFDEARYEGIFFHSSEPLWWVSILNEIIFSKSDSKSFDTKPWVIAPKIFDIPKEKWSKCFVCKKHFPETVGSKINNPDILRPVHYLCSNSDPRKLKIPYFNEPRSFK